jgi:hypothetical protein
MSSIANHQQGNGTYLQLSVYAWILSRTAAVSTCGAFVKCYFFAVCSVIIAIHTLHIVKEIVIKDLCETIHNKRRKKTTREESNNNEEREDVHNGKNKDNEMERERKIRRELFGYREKETNI